MLEMKLRLALRLALQLQYILCLVIITAANEGLIIQSDNTSFLDHGGREITNLSGPKASNRKHIRGAISRVSDEEVDSLEVNPRIVGGQTAEKGAYPYMAVALYQERYFTCGGALVARNVVLLAAHCASRVDGILIGRQNLGRYDPKEEYFAVVERAIHHDFKFLRPPTNDFMLVKLDGNSTYSPVAIDFDGISQDIAGKEVAMVGWGQTGSTSGSRTLDLQVGFLDLLTNQQCAAEWWGNFIGRDMICAYREGKKNQKCFKDVSLLLHVLIRVFIQGVSGCIGDR